MFIALYTDHQGGRGDATEAVPIDHTTDDTPYFLIERLHDFAKKIDSHLVWQDSRGADPREMVPYYLKEHLPHRLQAVFMVHDDEMDMPYAEILVWDTDPTD